MLTDSRRARKYGLDSLRHSVTDHTKGCSEWAIWNPDSSLVKLAKIKMFYVDEYAKFQKFT